MKEAFGFEMAHFGESHGDLKTAVVNARHGYVVPCATQAFLIRLYPSDDLLTIFPGVTDIGTQAGVPLQGMLQVKPEPLNVTAKSKKSRSWIR